MTSDNHGMPEGWPIVEGWEVSPAKVKAMLDAGEDVTLLDCRTEKEHAVANIGQAIFVPMQDIPAKLEDLEEYEDRKLVVFCHAGVRSMKVTQFLRERGYEDAWSMAGGIDLWSKMIDDSVPRY